MVWTQALAERPYVMLLGGDYVKSETNIDDLDGHRDATADLLGSSEGILVIAVPLNHETWSALLLLCSMALGKAGVVVLENENIHLKGLNLCIRVFGGLLQRPVHVCGISRNLCKKDQSLFNS
jgi:hypothetical protein